MRFADIIPPCIKEFTRLSLLRLRFPRSNIYTPFIDNSVRLGQSTTVHRGVQIISGTSIGDYSYVNDGTLIGAGTTIGRFCSIGYYCSIGMHEHPIDHLSTSPFTYGPGNIFGGPSQWNDFRRPTTIGSDVWIGSHATILQEVTVGNGAVVAAGAVVTKRSSCVCDCGGCASSDLAVSLCAASDQTSRVPCMVGPPD